MLGVLQKKVHQGPKMMGNTIAGRAVNQKKLCVGLESTEASPSLDDVSGLWIKSQQATNFNDVV